MKEKVLRIDRPEGRRVLKFDGAFGPEGCGIALSGDEYEVSVTGFTFSAIWHDKHSGHWLAALVTKEGNAFSRAKPGLLVFSRAKARL